MAKAMIRRLTRHPKARWLIGGWVAVELASLPAAAAVLQSTPEGAPDSVTAVEVVLGATDRAQYLVVADAPFVILSDSGAATFRVEVQVSGAFGPARFGDRAQVPGALASCAQSDGGPIVVYASERGTVVDGGAGVDMAVLVSVGYPDGLAPELSFALQSDTDAPLATACR